MTRYLVMSDDAYPTLVSLTHLKYKPTNWNRLTAINFVYKESLWILENL